MSYDANTGETDEVRACNLGDGALIERLDEALQDMWNDIHDPNTKATARRSVVLTISCVPDEERQVAVLEIDATTKRAKHKPAIARVELARSSGGQVAAFEIRNRQMSFEERDDSTNNVRRLKEV